MVSHRAVVLLIISLLAGAPNTEAFNVVRSSRSVRASLGTFGTPSPATLLRATEDNTTDEESANNDGSAESPTQEKSDSATKTKAPKKSAADDILNSPDFLKRKLEVLKSDVAQAKESLEQAQARLEANKAEWGAQLDELAKEYKNIQTRMNTQSNASNDQATMQVARKMLNVLDNFDRAFGAVQAETESEKAIEAEYRKSYDEILAIFDRLGIQQVETLGIPFDYEYHQAVLQMPSDEDEEGLVCKELAKGFKIGDTLIRAAMVAVAA